MHAAFVVAARDLRSRVRDRSGLLAGVVAPTALAVIISLAFGAGDAAPQRIALADEDASALSKDIAGEIVAGVEDDEVELARAADEEEAREMVSAGEVGAAVVLPAGLAEAMTGGPGDATVGGGEEADTAEVRVLAGEGAAVATIIAEAIAGEVAAQAEHASTAVAASISLAVQQRVAEGAFDDLAEAGDDLDALLLPEGVESFEALAVAAGETGPALMLADDADADPRLDAASYFGPSMAVLSALLVITSAPRALIRERRQGTLQRLRAAPIPAWAPAAGLGLSVGLVGAVGMAVVLTVVSVALGASLGDPAGLVALSLAVVAFAAALSALIASRARTEAQADGIATAVVFSLALVGGHFIELHALPEGLQALAHATPNGWALRGYTALAADGASLGEIVLPIAVVLGFAVAVGLAAVPGLRRQEASR